MRELGEGQQEQQGDRDRHVEDEHPVTPHGRAWHVQGDLDDEPDHAAEPEQGQEDPAGASASCADFCSKDFSFTSWK